MNAHIERVQNKRERIDYEMREKEICRKVSRSVRRPRAISERPEDRPRAASIMRSVIANEILLYHFKVGLGLMPKALQTV